MEIKQCKEFYYRVNLGDTIPTLCQKFNTSKENILRNNNQIDLYAGEWIYIKQNDYILHIVKPMETLNDVAKKHNVEMQKISKDNNLISTKLFIGQELKIYK